MILISVFVSCKKENTGPIDTSANRAMDSYRMKPVEMDTIPIISKRKPGCSPDLRGCLLLSRIAA